MFEYSIGGKGDASAYFLVYSSEDSDSCLTRSSAVSALTAAVEDPNAMILDEASSSSSSSSAAAHVCSDECVSTVLHSLLPAEILATAETKNVVFDAEVQAWFVDKKKVDLDDKVFEL